MSDRRLIKVRSFKWRRRPTSVTVACLLSKDPFGQWLGVARGDPWWSADGSRSGVFDMSLVKVVPHDTFWTACFYPGEPVVDVDIVLPVDWVDDVLEEVDLELDILRSADGSVRVRDRDECDRVRAAWAMPVDIAAQAEEACEQVRELVEQGAEPFDMVGRMWLSRFLAEADATDLLPGRTKPCAAPSDTARRTTSATPPTTRCPPTTPDTMQQASGRCV